MATDTKSLLTRGVVDVIVKKELEDKLSSGKKLKVKYGIDPSGSDLHIGHMVVLKKLREFQDLGHEIQMIFGNFTGQIGDPSGKLDSRKMLTQDQVEENAKEYLKQASKIIDPNKVQIHWNADWLGKLSFADVIALAKTFTVHQMLERDMYQDRVKKEHPIYLHEFMYPLMQGYDSVALESDLELGGTDQTFNLLAGRTIQKAYGQTPQSILTVPILEGTDGKEKMGKSLNNYIGVMDSPKDMFGKTMSIPDSSILNYFILATNLDMEEVDKIKEALEEGENPRNLKVRLAKEILAIYHSQGDADREEEEFNQVFAKKELPTDIEKLSLGEGKWNIIELIAATKFQGSKSEIRRLIQGGAVKIDSEKIDDLEAEIDISEEKLLQIGKRTFYKVKI